MKKFLFLCTIASALSLQAAEKTVVLFTGLPCAGKTTISKKVHEHLPNSVMIDGDAVRKTINKDLGFSKEDREENLRRVVEMAKLVAESTPLTLLSFVSPYEGIRAHLRSEFEKSGIKFLEVFVNAEQKTCIDRDVKGMYAKALAGEIAHFTGISAPYEAPSTPDLVCNTDQETLEESTGKVIAALGRPHPQQAHALFIGRWSPFHKGHWAIMEKVYKENPDRPLMIFVRDNESEYWSAEFRKGMVEAAMAKMNIPATVMIIPDIDSVNWGRGVGYTPRMVDVDVSIQNWYSGTKIRGMLENKDESWRSFVCDGADDYIINHSK